MPRTPEPSPSERTSTTLVSLIQERLALGGVVSAVIAVSGGLAIILAGVLLLFIPELRGAAYTVLAVGGVLLLISLMISFGTVIESITGRRGRYSTNTAIMVSAFVITVALVYVIAERNPSRSDLTATKQFSLASQSLEILKNLPERIQATAFFVEGVTTQEQFRIPVDNLLNELEVRSSRKFSYRFINPDLQPSLADQYNVTTYPTVVFEGMESGRFYRLTAPLFQERDFTSALLVVTGEQRKRLYYLEGHGERDFRDIEADSHQGFGFATTGLIGDYYDVVEFSLYAEEEPHIEVAGENAIAAVIIAGPTQDLIEKEIRAIDDYLKRGGRLILLLEPNSPQSYKDLLARWGVTMDDGFVIDEASNVAGETQTPLISRRQYGDTPPIDAITKPLDQSYFPGTASFRPSLPPEEMPDTLAIFPLARTTLLSCITDDVEVNECSLGGFDFRVPAVAITGIAPLNERPDPTAPQETKIVAFGDTDFVTNFHIFSVSNVDLFLNSVNWLTEDVDLSGVRPKPASFRFLVVTGREMQVIRALSWFVLPGAMALMAGVVWWRRR